MRISHLKQLIIVFIGLLTHGASVAQDAVKFTAEVSKNRLGVNERIRIDFEMNEDGDNFVPPSFEGFEVVMGPTQSVSRSIINGVRSFSKSYGFVLQPTAKGNFTIGAASIEINGKIYKTNPIKITVGEAVSNPSMDKTADDIVDDNIFLVAEISKTNPYINEGISIIYRLYIGSQVGLSDLKMVTNPKYPDFWNHELPIQRYEIEECTYQGKSFRCIVVKQVVLYPQKSGTIELEALTLDLLLQVPTQQRDFFGRPLVTQASKRVVAGKRNLQVRPLPEQGKPDNFTGAVGKFTFDVTTSKSELKGGESLQAKVEINGEGNLKLFDIPKLTFPSSLEVYDPEQTDQISTSLSGMKGNITQSYTVVPQYKGKYPVPSVSFSYFDPTTSTYHSIQSNELLIDVTEGTVNSQSADAYVSRQSVQTQGKQFRFLQLTPNLQPINQPLFFGSTAYYLWLFLPLLIIPIVVLTWRAKKLREGDLEGNRIRQANRLAKKYLGDAKRKLNDQNTFYEALERALHNYLKAKLKIETSELSKEKIMELLQQKHVKEQSVNEFITLLGNCEMARYSTHTPSSMENDYQRAVTILSDLDKQIKKGVRR
ncbi:MAG: BatD family protein [Capnocytophaga sp.]|nr:BatD family protein [Capnocytophaga sp.]